MDPLFQEAAFRIESSPLRSTPFSHFMIEGIFSPSFYADLLKNLPDPFYYQSSKEYPQRRSLPIHEHTLTLLESDGHLFDFWSRFKKGICSDAFLSVVLKKFNAVSQAPLEPIVQLIKDKDHYSIGPHTDIPQKMITLLFYLPASTDQAHLGTSLYRPLDAAFRCPYGKHYPFESFEKVAQAPFLPNSVFGFLRTDDSFHGVELIGAHEKERNLLTYTVWAKHV